MPSSKKVQIKIWKDSRKDLEGDLGEPWEGPFDTQVRPRRKSKKKRANGEKYRKPKGTPLPFLTEGHLF